MVEGTVEPDRPGIGPYPAADSCMRNRMPASLVPGIDPPWIVGKLRLAAPHQLGYIPELRQYVIGYEGSP